MKTYLLTTAVLMACLATANAGEVSLTCPAGSKIISSRIEVLQPVAERKAEKKHHIFYDYSFSGQAPGILTVDSEHTSDITIPIASTSPLESDKTEQTLTLESGSANSTPSFICSYKNQDGQSIELTGNADIYGCEDCTCTAQGTAIDCKNF